MHKFTLTLREYALELSDSTHPRFEYAKPIRTDFVNESYRVTTFKYEASYYTMIVDANGPHCTGIFPNRMDAISEHDILLNTLRRGVTEIFEIEFQTIFPIKKLQLVPTTS